MSKIDSFPKEVHEKLGYYVYRLIDPRNGQTFYVGKGKGNRVFQHISGKLSNDSDPDDMMSMKNDRIAAIRKVRNNANQSLEPLPIIHRHGMDEDTAFEVESALIDAIGDLTNVVKGHGSQQFGPASTIEIINSYCAQTMDIDPEHNILAISINKTYEAESSIYNSVRYAWRMNKNEAEKADYVFAIYKGVCKGIFIAQEWLPADHTDFQSLFPEDIQALSKRIGFIGQPAPIEIQNKYLNKKLPDEYLWKRGAATPFKYIYKHA